MVEPSYNSPRPLGQGAGGVEAPFAGAAAERSRRRSLLASGLISLGGGALLLGLLGLWTSHAFGLEPAVAGRAFLFYMPFALLVLLGLHRHLPLARFGPANGVTLLRCLLACWLAALVGRGPASGAEWLPAAVAGLALGLDGLDGWVARRGGWASAFGARFDMECDAFFLAVLSALVFQLGGVGPWILLAGALRYLFVAAGWRWAWLRRPLAPRFTRKAAYALAAGTLVACLVPGLPAPLAAVAAGVALALLSASFLRDVLALRRAAAGDER